MYIFMYSDGVTKRYSIAEARANLPRLVDEVVAGSEVELTRRGRTVAVVLSQGAYQRLRAERPRFRDAYQSFTATHALAEVGLDEGYFEALRARDAGRKVEL
jgi:prevent-host-death family protein